MGSSDGHEARARDETTFCIIDFTRVTGDLPAAYTTCGQNDTTGLTVGWGDTYGYHLWEQWVKLGPSKLADGTYVLRSIADPLNKLHESKDKNGSTESIEDNQKLTCFTVRGNKIRAGAC